MGFEQHFMLILDQFVLRCFCIYECLFLTYSYFLWDIYLITHLDPGRSKAAISAESTHNTCFLFPNTYECFSFESTFEHDCMTPDPVQFTNNYAY